MIICGLGCAPGNGDFCFAAMKAEVKRASVNEGQTAKQNGDLKINK